MKYITGLSFVYLFFLANNHYANGASFFSTNKETLNSITLTFDTDNDSLFENYVETLIEVDSLQTLVISLQDSIRNFKNTLLDNTNETELFEIRIDSLEKALTHCMFIADTLSQSYKKILPTNFELSLQIENLQKKIDEQNRFLEEQSILMSEKDKIIKEKEGIYREVLTTSQLDLLKLEGKINVKEQELLGKTREIDLLSANIADKQKDMDRRNEEISEIAIKREAAGRMIDSLKDTLYLTQKSLIKLTEEHKQAQREIAELKEKMSNKDKKEKPVAIVQGVALRAFRTPLYVLSPKSAENTTTYSITNDNGGNVEFDFVTGATVRIKKISKADAAFNADLGWFVGFGGNNIFKNFYIGPNIKIFDFIHINTGLNFAEFRVLKDGFSEGQDIPLGTPIPTVNKWKTSLYIALTFDFDLIAQIVSKI